MKNIVFMYAGQGTQYYQMGAELYRQNSIFNMNMNQLDKIAYEILNRSVIETLYNEEKKPQEQFLDLQQSNAGIFMVEYSLTKVLLSIGIVPNYVLGASLGEYISLAISNTCDCEAILRSLINHGGMFNNIKNGAMLSILDDINIYHDNAEIFSGCDIAAYNYEKNFVISGENNNIGHVENYLLRNNIVYVRLPIKIAFHSKSIDGVKDAYLASIKYTVKNDPDYKIVSCSEIKINPSITSEYFWGVVRKPIKFYETITMLEEIGECLFIDVSPTGTLANFINYRVQNRSEAYSIMGLFSNINKKLDVIKQAFRKNVER